MKPTRLQLAEHAVSAHYHVPEFGVSLTDVCQPAYWTHVSRTLRPGDKIEILSPTGDWWAMLIVRMTGKVEASVSVLQHVVLEKPDEITTPASPYEVKWRGPSVKFSVIRKEDGGVVKENFESKDAANQWVKNHMKAMAA